MIGDFNLNIDERLVRTMANCLVNQSPCNTDKRAVFQLSKLIKEITMHLEMGNMEKACNWILEENRWLENENSLLEGFYNYGRGDIIRSLDFGTANIGTEHRYPHPAVVIYDQREDWVVAAPITAAHRDRDDKIIDHPPFEVLVRRQIRKPANENEFFFTKDSVIQVDQIRRVSKYRAVTPTRFKLRAEYLDQIDDIILKYFTPRKYNLLSQVVTLNESLKEEIQAKDKKLFDLLQSFEDIQVELQAQKIENRILRDKKA